MDPLDILTNKEHILPYFQPIFSADEHRVAGYEVLGRIQDGDHIRSLGPFFHDESIPEEYRLEIDDLVLHMALDRLLEDEDNSLIVFINRDANLLMPDRGESLLSILLSYRERGLSLNRVVIEVSEHDFTGDIETLNHLFTYFRTYGIQLAVDNVGKDGSNLDRLRLLQPDIFKVDLRMLKKTSDARTYQDVLYSLSMLARKIGAALMYEDIEAEFQLQYAWRHGGRYYQGYYLGEPGPDFIEATCQQTEIRQSFDRFISREKNKLQAQYIVANQFAEKLQPVCAKFKTRDFDGLIEQAAKVLHSESFRIYICDEHGFQQSSNIFKRDGEWQLQPDYLQKNWSWRPYFLENIVRMNFEKRGILSDVYSDIETGETIRTYSYPLEGNYYLFIDIAYDFLFERDELL
ncbi:EAL-associated domain-containing protein [Bacillus tianshenii]|nr:EAL-associated domain-containing protein [Bacillus tianshenii]